LSGFVTTGLQTNLRKTSVTPISCDSIDLDAVLANLPLARASFPIKYIGLPLTPRRLKKIDFQPLVDKAAGKLSTWNGRNLTQAGCVYLVKSVLSSQPVYLLTVLKPTKETLLELEKLRRYFLWAGADAISGGKCKVNWMRTTLPKDLGGLGVLHLEKFARALRLRWLWHEWTSLEKAWVGTEVPCDDADRILFANCTRITLGNGSKTSFWGPAGFMDKDLRTLRLCCSPNRGRKSDWSPQLYTITHGCGTSTIELVSLRSTSRNSSPFGASLRQRSYTSTVKIRSSGPGRPMAFTTRPLHIEPNSQTALLLPI
jgi:hypothetical protein